MGEWFAAAGGLAVGSFLGMAAYRLPRGLSLVRPRSRCPACGRCLGPAELVPLLSFLWQRGRCRGCGSALSWRYPAIEATNAALWLLVAAQGRGIPDVVLGWVLASSLLLAAAIDLERRIIPNPLNAAAALLWLPVALFAGRLGSGLGGAALLGGVLLAIALIRPGAMGIGDVKLGAVIGLYLGWRLVPVALLLAAASGAAVGLLLIGLGLKTRKDPIPFGPFLALGAMAAFLWGEPLLRGYLRVLA